MILNSIAFRPIIIHENLMTQQNTKHDSHIQNVYLVDFPNCDGIYEVKFTADELQSNETFCKGISNVISRKLSPVVAYS